MAQDCKVSIMKTHSDIRHDQQGVRGMHFKIFPSRDFAFCKEQARLSCRGNHLFSLKHMCLYFKHLFLEQYENVHLVERQISEYLKETKKFSYI